MPHVLKGFIHHERNEIITESLKRRPWRIPDNNEARQRIPNATKEPIEFYRAVPRRIESQSDPTCELSHWTQP